VQLKGGHLVRQHSLIVLILMGLALFGMTTPAHAGPVVVSLEQLPDNLQAGQPFTVGFLVVSHGKNGQLGPVAGLAPVVRATLGDERVQVLAEPANTPGHYRATLILPAPGVWEWRIAAFGDPQGYALTPLQVAETTGAAPVEGAITPAAATGALRVILRGAGAILVLLAVALAFVGPRRAWLRRPGPA
jgi:hypothetical protein